MTRRGQQEREAAETCVEDGVPESINQSIPRFCKRGAASQRAFGHQRGRILGVSKVSQDVPGSLPTAHLPTCPARYPGVLGQPGLTLPAQSALVGPSTHRALYGGL